MGIDKLTEKEIKEIKFIKKNNILLYVGIVAYILCMIYLWFTKQQMIDYINNQDKAPILTGETLKEYLGGVINSFIILLIVPIGYCLGWIRSNSKLRKIIYKLLDK